MFLLNRLCLLTQQHLNHLQFISGLTPLLEIFGI